MFSRVHSFRFLAVAVAAFLMVTGLQSGASAATARTLSISASPTVGVVGTSVTFSGKLSRSPKGTLVTIQRKSGSRWVKAGTTRTVNTKGSYAVRLARPRSVGTFYYRATSAKKGSLKAATSKRVAVAALRRTLVSLSCPDTVSCDAVASKTKTTAGTAITLSGTVLPYVKGTLVTLQRKAGSSWTNVTSTTVLPNGTFNTRSGTVVPTTSTTYRASVSRTTLNAPGLSNERTVNAKPLITTSALPAATRFNPYSTTLANLGGQAGTWSATGLPTGLSVNASTGVISGTSTSTFVGDTNVVIGFTQLSTGLAAATKTLTLHVNQATPPTITTSSFVIGKRLSAYSTQLAVAGNPAPAGTWTASPLPDGLTLTPATGVISGTPTTVQSVQVVVGFTQTSSGLSAQPKTITLTIDDADAPVISTTSLPNGAVDQAYSKTLTVQGNPAGTWSATGLPASLDLDVSTGVISGTPVLGDDGDYDVVIGFKQTSTGLDAAPKNLTLRIGEGTDPVITTTSLPVGVRMSAYPATTLTVTTTGAAAGTWSVTPAMPVGLSLNPSTGEITGTPTDNIDVGDNVLTFRFTQTSTMLFAEKTLNLHINQAASPVISTVALTTGDRFVAYTTTLTASGNPAGTWTASPLPAGLTLAPSTGVISGTPTDAGDTQVVIGFTQTSTGLSATPKTLTLHVNQAPAPVISTANLPEGTRFSSYTTTLTATVTGNPAGTWSASPLPVGLSLNPTTGVISGTPTAVGDTNVVIGFTQTSTGLDATPKTLTLHVNEATPPVIATNTLPDGTRYSAYTTTLTVSGNPAGTWTNTALPAGMSFNTTTGVLSGAPRTAGDFSITFGFTQTNSGLVATPKTLVFHVAQANPVILTASALPDGSPLAPYNVQLEVAPAPVGKWTLVSGGPPVGITLKDTGQLSGSALFPGNYTFIARFTETSTNLYSQRTFTLHIS